MLFFYSLGMIITVKIKLIPSREQKDILLQTFEAFNAAANDAAAIGFDNKVYSQPSIHRLCYFDLRERYGLSSQLAVHATKKAATCFARDKTKCPVFKKRSAISYDQRNMSFKGLTHVSIASLDGRLVIPMVIAGYQESKLTSALKSGEADLVYVKGTFYLLVSITVDELPPGEVKKALGVDLGVENIAVDSSGEFYSGAEVEAKRVWFQSRRNILQSVGTKSAKRRLRSMSKKEANYRRTLNHQIARKIVDSAKALGAKIVLEDLNGIRDRTRFRKKQRSRMSGWSFFQLRSFIAYKAKLVGVVFETIDPRNTSRTCPKCKHCDKANRKTQSKFKCVQCGFHANADLVAAVNIAAKGVVNTPTVGIVKQNLNWC